MKKKAAGFRVTSASYGLSEKDSVDVTAAVQDAATADGLTLKVNNANLGKDPYPKQRKRLFVTYKQGTSKGKASSIEGTTIRIGAGA